MFYFCLLFFFCLLLQDLQPLPPLEKTKDDILLFFKLYDPSKEEIRYYILLTNTKVVIFMSEFGISFIFENTTIWKGAFYFYSIWRFRTFKDLNVTPKLA